MCAESNVIVDKRTLERIIRKEKKLANLVEVVPSRKHAVKKKTLKSSLFYIDGGARGNKEIKPKPRYKIKIEKDGDGEKKKIKILIPSTVQHVSNLYIPTTEDGLRLMKGLNYVAIRVPRKIALHNTGLGRTTKKSLGRDGSRPLLHALSCTIKKANDMAHGRSSRIGIQCQETYACVGGAAKRGGRGIEEIHHAVRDMEVMNQNEVHRLVTGVEQCFREYMPSDAIYQVQRGIEVAGVPLFSTPNGKTSKIYQAFACAKNVYLSAHVDRDYTFSAVMVLKEGEYGLDDEVVAYFNFPRLGVSIPLRPGDLLFFDPSEYHMISSRCKDEDDIYCISFYLKSNLIGGNDNSSTLNEEQKEHLNEEQMKQLAKEEKKRLTKGGIVKL